MDYRIYIAHSKEDFAQAKKIVAAYVDFLNIDLSFQDYQNELDNFHLIYGLPKGCMVLAEVSGELVGAVGLRYLCEGVSEMKRMFVLPKY